MKKLILGFLFTVFSIASFAQNGAVNGSAFRSKLNPNDSTTITYPLGYGFNFYNSQATTPRWQFWNGSGVKMLSFSSNEITLGDPSISNANLTISTQSSGNGSLLLNPKGLIVTGSGKAINATPSTLIYLPTTTYLGISGLSGSDRDIAVDGSASNIDMKFTSKGTGTYNFSGTSSQAGTIKLFEDVDDGTNYSTFKTGSQSGNINYTLPTSTPGSDGYVLSTTTAGVMSWSADATGITNSAAANELMKSDGTNAVASGVFSTTLGDLTLGTSGGAGNRIIDAANSGSGYLDLRAGGITYLKVGGATNGAIVGIGGSNQILKGESTNGNQVDFTIAPGDPTGSNRNGGTLNLTSSAPTGSGTEGIVNIQQRTAGKLGFFNVTSVVKQSAVTTSQGIADALVAYGLLPTSTISGGGAARTYIVAQVVGTNANITATYGTTYYLPAATLSTARTIDMTALNTDMDYIEITNNEGGFTWSFTGQTVYLADNTTTVSALNNNTTYQIRRINGRLRVIN